MSRTCVANARKTGSKTRRIAHFADKAKNSRKSIGISKISWKIPKCVARKKTVIWEEKKLLIANWCSTQNSNAQTNQAANAHIAEKHFRRIFKLILKFVQGCLCNAFCVLMRFKTNKNNNMRQIVQKWSNKPIRASLVDNMLNANL